MPLSQPKTNSEAGQPSLGPLEVRSDLRPSDLYWIYFSAAIRKLLYARWTLAVFLILLVALRRRYLAYVGLLLLPPFLYILLGGLIFVATVLPYMRSRDFVRGTMGSSGILSYAFSAQGIDMRRPDSQAHFDWTAVRKAKQTSNLILIYVDSHSALVIPKRCFAGPQQLQDVRTMVGTYAKSRVRRQEYWP